MQEKTPNNNLTAKIMKNKKPYVQSNCPICKKLKSQFVSISKIHGDGVLGQLSKHTNT